MSTNWRLESVHSCHAGPSAWQAGGGAAFALVKGEDRGEPLNVYSVSTEEYLRVTLRIRMYCSLCDQGLMR